MTAFNKFNIFVADCANKVHNLGADTLKFMLTDSAPVATNTVKANITQLANANGYTTDGNAVGIASSSQSSGLYKLVASGNVVFTAAGGSIGPFRYAVLMNSTPSAGPLIGWYDYGAEITITNGNTFTVVEDLTNGIVQNQ